MIYSKHRQVIRMRWRGHTLVREYEASASRRREAMPLNISMRRQATQDEGAEAEQRTC